MGCGGVKKPALSSSKGERVRKGLLEEKAAAGSIILKIYVFVRRWLKTRWMRKDEQLKEVDVCCSGGKKNMSVNSTCSRTHTPT